MSAPKYYSGPAKVTQSLGTGPSLVSFFADGINGQVKLIVDEKRTKRGTASFGYHKSTLDDQTCKISLTPHDMWAILPTLYPPYLGVTTISAGPTTNAGALAIGTRPHDIAAGVVNGNAPSKIYTPDGRLYQPVRTAITGHPSMKLGVGQSLYGNMDITGLIDVLTPSYPGDSGALIAANAITESGASDPDSAGFVPDFINGRWTGNWGSITGFTGIDVEDFWTLTVDAKYSPLTVQKLTRHMKLDSVEFMVKGKLAGPTHTQLLAKILAHVQGGEIGEGTAKDLVLTGPSSKTITLKDCEVFLEGSGFEFGGTGLNTGEIAFVTRLDFSTGAPAAGLLFSI